MTTMTFHAQVEREARLNYIIDCLGDFGSPIAEAPDKYGCQNVVRILTDVGVLIVKDTTNNMVITAYIASVKQTITLYCTAHGCERCPNSVMKRARKNEKFIVNQP